MEWDRSLARLRAAIRPEAVTTHTFWQVRGARSCATLDSRADHSESFMNHRYVRGASVLAGSLMFAPGFVGAQTSSISPAMQSQIRELYRTLIEAENSHDIEKV